MAASRALASSPLASETRMHQLLCRPRPTLPRSWWSCESPKRSAFSMTMSAAFGTSTPTSMTVVETSTSRPPLVNCDMSSSFSFAFSLPWIQPIRSPGSCSRSSAACSSADLSSSWPSSPSSMRGQTTKT